MDFDMEMVDVIAYIQLQQRYFGDMTEDDIAEWELYFDMAHS
jgi:hypothetical protein